MLCSRLLIYSFLRWNSVKYALPSAIFNTYEFCLTSSCKCHPVPGDEIKVASMREGLRERERERERERKR